jgi:hypothetical protein
MFYANRGNKISAGSAMPLLGLFTGGSVLRYSTSGGTQNNLNPGGSWPSTAIGRIDVDTTAGAEVWTGLVAVAQDGYGVMVTVVNGANTLTLDNENAGSSSGNQFFGSGNIVLSLGQRTILIVTNSQWFMA